MNCWEFKKCGREKSCPAYPDYGRQCARVTRSLYVGLGHGIFAIKLAGCLHCDFHRSEYYDRIYGRTFGKTYGKTRSGAWLNA